MNDTSRIRDAREKASQYRAEGNEAAAARWAAIAENLAGGDKVPAASQPRTISKQAKAAAWRKAITAAEERPTRKRGIAAVWQRALSDDNPFFAEHHPVDRL